MQNKEVLEYLEQGYLIKEFHGIRKISFTIDGWKVRSNTVTKFINSKQIVVDSVTHSGFTVRYYKLNK